MKTIKPTGTPPTIVGGIAMPVTVSGLSATQLNVLTAKSDGKLRSYIVARKDINLTPLTSYSTNDITAVLWNSKGENGSKPIVVVPAYLPGDAEQPTTEL